MSARIRNRVVVATLALVAGAGCDAEKKAPPKAPPPPVVYVAAVERHDVPLYLESVGTIDGYINADIRARVRGYLKSQTYKDGAFVKSGQLLFTIEPDEYNAALSGAKASVERAHVAQTRNRVLLERSQGLFKTGMLSQQDLDNASAGSQDATGQVQAAQAALQQANLNLSYTQLRSPIEGVAGLASVRVGNLVGQDGPTLLTIVSQVDPVRVTFPVSEVDYVRYPDRFQHLSARDLAWAKKQFARLAAAGRSDPAADEGIELVLSDGKPYARRGVIVSANRQIDSSTGTIELQALFPNPDQSLRPGQYGRVRIRAGKEGDHVLAVPEKALISVQGTYSVAVVGADHKVALRKVALGASAGGMRIVQAGVNEGDQIVVEGVQKVADGAPVQARPAPVDDKATASATPVPATAPATPEKR